MNSKINQKLADHLRKMIPFLTDNEVTFLEDLWAFYRGITKESTLTHEEGEIAERGLLALDLAKFNHEDRLVPTDIGHAILKSIEIYKTKELLAILTDPKRVSKSQTWH